MTAACIAPRRALLTWLARGLAGVALLALAIWAQAPVIVIPALLLALVAFGGCPMCWTYGFVQRASRTLSKETP
ncbi:MAG: hypothetical protein AB7T59_05110 [Hyphomonadaceae bacterium]